VRLRIAMMGKLVKSALDLFAGVARETLSKMECLSAIAAILLALDRQETPRYERTGIGIRR